MKATVLKSIFPITLALFIGSGCIVVEEDDSHPRSRPSTTTTTTTTTTSGPVHEYEDEVIIEEEVVYVGFSPAMGAVTTEILDRDPSWGTSWQFYTMQFSDVADTFACDEDMAEFSEGSVASLHINGFEVDDEYAACPVGSYLIVPDCELFEGEACLDIQWRDRFGYDEGADYAVHGVVDVVLEPGFHGDPYLCHISTTTDHPELSFDFTLVFEPFELSAQDYHTDAVCTM